MTVTLADLISDTKQQLFTGAVDEINTVSGSLTNYATAISFGLALGGISPGKIISIDLELILVLSVSQTGVTGCIRGYAGSVAASHTAGTVVYVSPRFADFYIARALNQELASLSSPANGLFQVRTVDITYNPAIKGYDLTGVTDLLEIQEVRWKATGPAKAWPVIHRYELSRNMATTEFSSAYALFLDEGAQPGNAVHVRYRSGFTQWTTIATSNLTDDVQTVTGLPITANDIPPLGAAIRLAAPREIRRNFFESQGEPRRSEEVPPGAALNSMRGLQALRQSRISEEAIRLKQQYPTVRDK